MVYNATSNNQSIGVHLTKLIEAIIETELLSKSAVQAINTNIGFVFLEYCQKFQKNWQELMRGICTLDSQLQEISQQSKEKVDEFSRQVQKLLWISTLPIGNIGTPLPLYQAVNQFTPALGSGYRPYMELCKSIKIRLQKFELFMP
jgi:hypothetical protein